MKLVPVKLRKRVFAAAAAAVMTVSAFGGISADAFEVWSFSDDLTVYVNGQKIDNTIYKPIIANDRTLVRLVPVFKALGYEYGEMDENKMIQFVQKDTNSVYTFKAESTKAVAGTGAILEDGFPDGEEHYLDVSATLQFCDVFYVPIRSFCEMTNLDIEWDDATRTVYVGSKPETAENHALTYNEARTLAEQYVNDSSISLGENTTSVVYNGRNAYEFRLYSKGMTSGGGSGFMGMIVYVYIDNGEIVTAEGSGESTAISVNTTSRTIKDGEYKQYAGDDVVGMCTVSNSTGATADVTVTHLRMNNIEYHIDTLSLQDDGTYVAYGDMSGVHAKFNTYQYEPLKFVFSIIDDRTIQLETYNRDTGNKTDTIIFVSE